MSKSFDNIENKFKSKLKSLSITMRIDDGEVIDIVQALKLGADLENPFALLTAMDEHSSQYAYFANLLADVKSEKEQAERDFKLWFVQKREGIFHSLKRRGRTRPTQDDIHYEMLRLYKEDEEFVEITNQKKELFKKESRLQFICEAFKYRKDLLISIGTLFRTLVDNKIIILDKKFTKGGVNNV